MKQKNILILVISAFVIVLAWIAFTVYHNLETSTIPDALSIKIIPINPTFDEKTIEKIKQRKKVAPLFQVVTSVTPMVSITPIALPSLQIPSPQASQSGGVSL